MQHIHHIEMEQVDEEEFEDERQAETKIYSFGIDCIFFRKKHSLVTAYIQFNTSTFKIELTPVQYRQFIHELKNNTSIEEICAMLKLPD